MGWGTVVAHMWRGFGAHPPSPHARTLVMCPTLADANRAAIGRVEGVFEAIAGVLRAHKDSADTVGEACRALCNAAINGGLGTVSRNASWAWWWWQCYRVYAGGVCGM